MLRPFFLSAAAFVLAAGLAAWAQDAETRYTIQRYETKPGDTVTFSRTSSGVNTVNVNAGIVKKNETFRNGEKTSYTEQVIERPAGASTPTKALRTYEAAEKTVKNEARRLSYQRQTVTIEKVRDRFAFTMNGRRVDDSEDLEKEFNFKSAVQSSDFLPPAAVKVGDTWKPDFAKIARAVDSENKLVIDPARSTLTAKLVSVTKKGNALVGVIEVRATVAATQLTLPIGKFPLTPQSAASHTIVLETPIDGSAGTEIMSFETNLNLQAPFGKGTLQVTGQTKGGSSMTVKMK